MAKPIPFPTRPTEAERKLELEQDVVRVIAHNALRQVDDILEVFDDDETAAYFVFGSMVAAMAMQRCMIKQPDMKQPQLEQEHLKALRDFLKDIKRHMEEMD